MSISPVFKFVSATVASTIGPDRHLIEIRAVGCPPRPSSSSSGCAASVMWSSFTHSTNLNAPVPAPTGLRVKSCPPASTAFCETIIPARSTRLASKRREGRLEVELDRIRVHHLDRLDEADLRRAAALLVGQIALDIPLDRIGVEVRAVVVLDALPQFEDVGLRVRRLPRLRQRRDDLQVRVDGDQRIIDVVEHLPVHEQAGGHRVEICDIGVDLRLDRAALLRRARARRLRRRRGSGRRAAPCRGGGGARTGCGGRGSRRALAVVAAGAAPVVAAAGFGVSVAATAAAGGEQRAEGARCPRSPPHRAGRCGGSAGRAKQTYRHDHASSLFLLPTSHTGHRSVMAASYQ